MALRISRPVLLFFLKALVIFIGWKLLYICLLLPQRVPDKALTRSIAGATAGVLNGLSPSGVRYTTRPTLDTVIIDDRPIPGEVMDIYRNEERTLSVADACNGLELMVLYIGFIICFPATAARKWKFAVIGTVLIYLLNILRCTALVLIFIHYRVYLDFSHHFLFTFIVYAIIFLLWFIFTKKPRINGRFS